MLGFIDDAGATIGTNKSKATFQTFLYKLGVSNGWSSLQLDKNITEEGKYTFIVELVETTTHCIFLFVIVKLLLFDWL